MPSRLSASSLVLLLALVPAALRAEDAPAPQPAAAPATPAATEGTDPAAPASTAPAEEASLPPPAPGTAPAPAAEPAQTFEAQPASAPAAAPAAAPAEAPKAAPAKRKFGAFAVFGVGALAVSVFALILGGAALLSPLPVSSGFALVQNHEHGVPLPGTGMSLSPFIVVGAPLVVLGVLSGLAGGGLLLAEWYFNL